MRRWRGWLVIAGAAVALYAILGFFVVPWVARGQIVKLCRSFLHREATVGRVRFNPFTLDASVEGFDLKDRDGSDLLRLARLRANLQLWGMFRRVWSLREIAIEQPVAVARILSDGRPSVSDLFESDPAGAAQPRRPFPRVFIDRFVLAGGQVDFVDQTRTPQFAQTFAPLDLDLHGLTTVPDEAGDHEVTIGIGAKTKLHWFGRQTVEPLKLEGRFELTGISLPRVWEYVAPTHPLDLRDGSADVAWSYDLRRTPDGVFTASLDDASLTARGLAVRPRSGGEDWLTLPIVEAHGVKARWPESTAEVGELKLTEPRVVASIDAHGALSWQTVLEMQRAPATDEAQPWTAKIGKLEIVRGEARLDDRSVTPAVTTTIDEIALGLEGVSTDLQVPVRAHASLRINGTGQASAQGTIVPDPVGADLDVGLHGLELVPFQTYTALKDVTLKGGIAGIDGKLVLRSASPRVRFDGDLSVERFAVADAMDAPILAWDKASVHGVRLAMQPDRLRVADILVDRAFLKLIIDREGNINLTKVGSTDRTLGAPVAASALPFAAAPAAGSALPPIDVTKIALRNARIDYTDESLILPFGTDIHDGNGTIRDLSTSSAAPGRLDFEGRVSESGYVKASGTLRVADPFASSDVSVTFRDVSLPTLTPYMATFAGYAVKSGSLDLDIHYEIKDRHLVGDHRVVASDLVLGDKVEGANAPSLPVRMAIALLKDKDGRIDLQVPIEGTIDSPEFAYRKVFWQAVRTILGNIAMAPFRAIGRLFGHDEEDLDLVGFVSGRSDLLPQEQETLQKISGELAKRGELTVEIAGRFDPVADAKAIATARVEARIEAKRPTTESLEAILEALYSESFSPEQLEAKRQEFMPAPASTPAPEPTRKKRKKKDVSTAPPAPQGAFDAAGFYDALRTGLLEAEKVGDTELAELARSRAAAVAAALTAEGGLDPSRVKLADPAPVKRKKQGADLVASEMTLSAND